MALNFTLLTTKETTAGSEQLQVLQEEGYGSSTVPTDLSVLLGAEVYGEIANGNEELSTFAWTKTPNDKGRAMCVIGDKTETYA